MCVNLLSIIPTRNSISDIHFTERIGFDSQDSYHKFSLFELRGKQSSFQCNAKLKSDIIIIATRHIFTVGRSGIVLFKKRGNPIQFGGKVDSWSEGDSAELKTILYTARAIGKQLTGWQEEKNIARVQPEPSYYSWCLVIKLLLSTVKLGESFFCFYENTILWAKNTFNHTPPFSQPHSWTHNENVAKIERVKDQSTNKEFQADLLTLALDFLVAVVTNSSMQL